MILWYIALSVFLATLAGGVVALRLRDRLHLVLGFSAGAVAGVALFDLLPESISLGTAYHTASSVALFIALGFFGYLVLDRLILLHSHADDSHAEHARPRRGALGALTLSTHSFLDGVAIGISFQASVAVGLVVTLAVLTHDFSDGINTVNLVLRGGGGASRAWRWLLADALAPAVGIATTFFFRVPESVLGLVLAVFVGTFLYLSASDLIPESHHRHPRALTTCMTLLGALVLWAVAYLAG